MKVVTSPTSDCSSEAVSIPVIIQVMLMVTDYLRRSSQVARMQRFSILGHLRAV